jgi:Ca2+-binding EF-hand superfamily protein
MKLTFNDNELQKLKQFFQEADKDRNGKIDRQELRELLERIWGNESELDLKASVQSTFEKYDLNHDGFITFEELLSFADD